MENPDANQLPEADALPDGFVESSTEPVAPPTPTVEQEKPLGDYKEDSFSDLDHSDKLSANEFQTSQGGEEKTQKLRTFPVPLSETDIFEASEGLGEASSEGCTEQTEGTPVSLDSANLSEASVGVSGCSEVKEQVQANCQSSERSTEGGSEASVNNMKDTSSSDGLDTSKNRKVFRMVVIPVDVQILSMGGLYRFFEKETTEAKRKVKRAFKSEKEFLEFTLKYQQVLAERDAAIAVRDKLESLCRELQRQNKILMDECKRVSTEGQSLRLDLSSRFQDAIKDVSNKLEEQKDECLSQLKENEMLRTKLKQLAEQYTLSEQQFAQKLKQKSLELQLADLKIKQHEEKLVHEQSQMKLYAEQVSQLLATEKNLRLQLTADGEKFQQFQDALLKSNEVFETFKQEIEKMAKSIKELKKENSFLKSKCEKTDVTLIELVDERERLKKQLEKTKNQKEKLESLCRSLQAERKQSSIDIKSSE
uniref:Beta-taxilin n=1 Tax=Quercus lobata TaxID=97700 RepID=A0A7N2R9P4_QUELO